jgi:hypothetical protein
MDPFSEFETPSKQSVTVPQLAKPRLEMFSCSPELGKLFEALSKAQAEMKPAVMDMKNPHFNSMYASLTSCQDAYRGPLSKYGLCLTQQLFSEDQIFYIRSVLGHSSGQWMSNIFKLITDRNNMQGLGSAVTYGRRYGANSLIGVVDTEDDDGNAVASQTAQKPRQQTPVKPADVAPQNPNLNAGGAQGPIKQSDLSVAQIKRLFAIATARQWTNEQVKIYLKRKFDLESTQDMNRQQYDALILVIESTDYFTACLEFKT